MGINEPMLAEPFDFDNTGLGNVKVIYKAG